MSKWISASIVLVAFAMGSPAQAELFGLLGGPAQVGPQVMSAPMMAAPQKMGAVQSSGYPFVGGCCEAKSSRCGSSWNGFCGCSSNRLHGWLAARSCGTGCGAKGGAVQKSCGPVQKFGGPVQKFRGPAQKCGGPVQKFHGPAQKCGGPAQKCGGPAQKCGGPVQKGGFGVSQKSFGRWAPKFGPSCGPKCGPTCAPAYGKGCGAPKGCGHQGLFGRLHFGRGFGCGHAKGGCATVVDCGKGGCGKGSYGGGVKYDFGTPVPNDAPVPAEAVDEPTVPTPAPIVPPAPEKSARRYYSLFN